MAQPPTQQRPPPGLSPIERAELHRRHLAQQQAQEAAQRAVQPGAPLGAPQPPPAPPAAASEAPGRVSGGVAETPHSPSPSATPAEREGIEKHDRKSGVQEALDHGRDPPIPDDLVNTGGVPGGSPSRPMDPPPEGAPIGNQGATAPEPVKTGPTNEQPARMEPGAAAA